MHETVQHCVCKLLGSDIMSFTINGFHLENIFDEKWFFPLHANVEVFLGFIDFSEQCSVISLHFFFLGEMLTCCYALQMASSEFSSERGARSNCFPCCCG